MVGKIILEYEGKRVKEFRVTGNLNNSNTKIIMTNITPHIETMVKLIDSFKSVIYRNQVLQEYIRFITRHDYKFKGDLGIHRRT